MMPVCHYKEMQQGRKAGVRRLGNPFWNSQIGLKHAGIEWRDYIERCIILLLIFEGKIRKIRI